MAASNGDEDQSQTAKAILDHIYQRAALHVDTPAVSDVLTQARIELLCQHSIGADVRVLMACLLAHLMKPATDIRKPYAKLGDDSFGGRGYDERYIADFIAEHGLPCIRTTGFLTPAFRTKNVTLTRTVELEGGSPELNRAFLDVLNDVHDGLLSDEEVFVETVRRLLLVKSQRELELASSLAQLQAQSAMELSSERIVTLIQQHLASSYSSRLPVLVTAAIYMCASASLGERILPLQSHNAADRQTGALGDVEITLLDDTGVTTCYEVKDKRVTRGDIDQALTKVMSYWHTSGVKIASYIFITTERIDTEVQEYAATIYDTTGGIEFVVLDCIGFLRHFLHLFHRLRMPFLEAYQSLVLAEPDSAVRHELKVLLLALRRAAEAPKVAMRDEPEG